MRLCGKQKLHINTARLKMKRILLLMVVAVMSTELLKSQLNFSYPQTRTVSVSDDYHGTRVADPYRWLEDDRSQETADWVSQQNRVTQDYLAGCGDRSKIRARLKALWDFNKQSAPFKKGNSYFCFKNNGVQNQSVLYYKRVLEDPGMPLLDPNTFSADGTVSLSGISISHNGKYLAYGLSRAGSDWVDIHFMEIYTRRELPDVIKWVKFSNYSWRGEGIYYSRYNEPTGSELSQRNQFHKVYYHTLGTTQDKDVLIFENKSEPDCNFGTQVTDDERFLFVSTSKSTSGEKLMFMDLTNPSKGFVTVADDYESDYSLIGNIGETFYMLTNRKAPKFRLVSFSATAPAESKWKVVIPEGPDPIESVRFCNRKLAVSLLRNVSSKLFCYSLEGKLIQEIQLPGICRLNAFNSDLDEQMATYSIVQFTAPEQTYVLDASTWKSSLYFNPTIEFKSDDYITRQVFYKSKDGTKVPMFITHKKDLVPNPETPCFVYGYGGFNISLAPEFRIDRAVFLENGGIYCVPNLRGGGEFGDAWHKAGTKCSKQNVFDDFIAACDWLVKEKLTSYKKLAIHGRSNGGLLIGAVMTQRPDICRVALPTVGVLDMLRFHLFTIGRAWTTDYGCSDNKPEFECLYKYSPLHNVKDVNYPATMILTGDHDDRVVPAHSFKFAATLQTKNKSKEPMLIRVDVNAGHGAGKPTSKQIDEFADMWAFTFYKLGMHAMD